MLLDSVKKRLASLVGRTAQAADDEGPEIARVTSKEEIVEGPDRHRQLRRHREEKKGRKMQGSSGSLDLTEVDRMQKNAKARYLKIAMPKEIDHLVYKSHEAESEPNARHDEEDRSESSNGSIQGDEEAEHGEKRRSMSQHVLQARIFPSKMD